MKNLKGFMTAAAVAAAMLAFPAGAWAAQEVVVGGAISLTGRYSEPAGRLKDGRTLWVEEVNARGGLLGRKVRLVLRDDRSDPSTAVKLYERLLTQEKVDLCVAPYSSPITEATASITERYKCPIVADGAATRSIWKKGRKYIFGLVGPSDDYLRGAVEIAAKKGYKRIAIVNEDSLFSKAAANGAAMYAKKHGLQVVLKEEYPRTQTDFRPLLLKVKALNADALLGGSYFVDAAAITRQLKELNINLKIWAATVGPGLPRFTKDLGPLAEYVLGSTQWEPVPALGYPGIKEFIERFDKRFGYKPNYHAAQGYAAGLILEAAVKKAGKLDREALREQLTKLDIMTPYGRYKVGSDGFNSGKGLLLFQILKGERRLVWPDESREVAPVVPLPAWDKRPTM
ncbi:MAG: amino acid ABC transporter substrate-binding protein [Candidatus Tectomicrobia bacterium]|nr:amino acid ABC transporter substrate-binding protein [Candidatus Tectomicrobia bacterium]